ncbi:hypothetical protein B0E53_06314 [Micromonospora sp. MH33]|nr:hypothetical protein B0E53_06314 [Micromonospora sp. MH33]
MKSRLDGDQTGIACATSSRPSGGTTAHAVQTAAGCRSGRLNSASPSSTAPSAATPNNSPGVAARADRSGRAAGAICPPARTPDQSSTAAGSVPRVAAASHRPVAPRRKASTTQPCPTSRRSATAWHRPSRTTAPAYGARRRGLGRSRAGSRNQVASTAANRASAYGWASWAYRVTLGSSAKITPASTPVPGANIRAASAPTSAAAAVTASRDGTRSARSEAPNAAAQARMSRWYGTSVTSPPGSPSGQGAVAARQVASSARRRPGVPAPTRPSAPVSSAGSSHAATEAQPCWGATPDGRGRDGSGRTARPAPGVPVRRLDDTDELSESARHNAHIRRKGRARYPHGGGTRNGQVSGDGDSNGGYDAARGLRSFVAGMGGASHVRAGPRSHRFRGCAGPPPDGRMTGCHRSRYHT